MVYPYDLDRIAVSPQWSSPREVDFYDSPGLSEVRDADLPARSQQGFFLQIWDIPSRTLVLSRKWASTCTLSRNGSTTEFLWNP